MTFKNQKLKEQLEEKNLISEDLVFLHAILFIPVYYDYSQQFYLNYKPKSQIRK